MIIVTRGEVSPGATIALRSPRALITPGSFIASGAAVAAAAIGQSGRIPRTESRREGQLESYVPAWTTWTSRASRSPFSAWPGFPAWPGFSRGAARSARPIGNG